MCAGISGLLDNAPVEIKSAGVRGVIFNTAGHDPVLNLVTVNLVTLITIQKYCDDRMGALEIFWTYEEAPT